MDAASFSTAAGCGIAQVLGYSRVTEKYWSYVPQVCTPAAKTPAGARAGKPAYGHFGISKRNRQASYLTCRLSF